LETLLSSPESEDWIEISKMLLGPLPEVYTLKYITPLSSVPVVTDVYTYLLFRDFNSYPSINRTRILKFKVNSACRSTM
jgi:hypothetical protein